MLIPYLGSILPPLRVVLEEIGESWSKIALLMAQSRVGFCC